MNGRPRLSIPRRVFLGFALVLTVSGLVSVAGIVQHQRTAATLRLLHEGFLPLALAVGEIRATQSVFDTLLDRVLFERDTRATQAWFNRARGRRPVRLQKALAGISRVEALAPPSFAHAKIAESRRGLEHVNKTLNEIDERYRALFSALEAEDKKGAERILGDLRGHERTIARRLGVVSEIIQEQIAAISENASKEQNQSIAVLTVLILVSLAVGVLVTWWSQRMLSPLPLLQKRVEAVERGDFVHQLGPTTDDEIGRLARQFEQMVAALAARDSSLRQATERLRGLQQMQEQIVAGLRAAVLVIDGQKVIRSSNPAANALFGIGPEAIGRTLSDTGLLKRLTPLANAIAEVVSGSDRAVISSAILMGNPERKLDVLLTPFGAEPPVGRDRAVLLVAEDVTEELRTKERLIQTERLAAIGRMAAHVTHEVRSPLSSIGLNMELLEDELPRLNPEAQALISAIKREVESLAAITEEYLRVARLPNPRLEREDLAEVVRSTVQFLTPEIESFGIEIHMDSDSTLPPVAVDEGQIRQVLMNLLKNAREAMPNGGRVNVEVRNGEGGVLVRVRDQGVGIEPEQLEYLFDLFYTTKKYGTGLGLPLTQQIVLAHEGRIRCESVKGEGTTFELWFPAIRNQSRASSTST
ncbi:MAG: HAMP domain-containing protein [Deltaproteobacteria bacterium]|nr:HAMP domain-containing protein [Deltaproteobacteria bacterium]